VEDIGERAMRRAMLRLVPLLCLCYFIAYLDRVNTGFAKLQMNTSLGLDDSMFGLAPRGKPTGATTLTREPFRAAAARWM
jgi:hypothetical protein